MTLIISELNAAGKLILRICRTRSIHGFQDYHSRNIQRPPKRLMSTVAPQVKLDKDAFQDLLPSVTASMVKNPKISLVPEASSWMQQLLDYTLTGGKLLRGLMTVYAYEAAEKPENVTQESLRMARTLGWCVEILQTYVILADDLVDGSSTRRGKPCWHTQPGVGMWVIKDCLMMQSSLYEIFKVYFKKHPQYAEMVDLLNEAILYTTIGEHLDFMSNRTKDDYSLFTIEQYYNMVKYKTAHYTFKLPVMMGYLLANNSDRNLHRMVEEMCMGLGQLYQLQNDILDSLGDESVTGKKGTDIQEGKCSWLAVHALKLSNDAQRAFFIENYAHKDPAKVQNIKHLYQELKLQELYKKEELFLYSSIKEKASLLPLSDRNLFLKLLQMIYKRKM